MKGNNRYVNNDDLKKMTKFKRKAYEFNLGNRLNANNAGKNGQKAQNINSCGNYLDFTVWNSLSSGEVAKRLKMANFCKFRFCPICTKIKALKDSKNILGRINALKNQREVDFLMLTLTVKNVPMTDLRAQIKVLSEAFQRMKETKQFQKSILGYVRAIEFLGDDTKTGEAHPHFHTLLVVSKNYFKKNYISHDKWKNMWKDALRIDYEPFVDVRRIKLNKKNPHLKKEVSAVFEVVKYTIKPAKLKNMSDDVFNFLVEQTKGVRQFNIGGVLKNIKPIENDLFNEADFQFLQNEIFKFSQGDYDLHKISYEKPVYKKKKNK